MILMKLFLLKNISRSLRFSAIGLCFLAVLVPSSYAAQLAAKKYVDEGLATKLNTYPELAGNAGKVLTLNAASNGLEWSSVNGRGTAYQNGTATVSSGFQWSSTGQFNMIRKDLRSGLVTANLVVQKITSAQSLAANASEKIAQMPSGFYPAGVSSIWVKAVGYATGAEPNPLSAEMDSSGGIYLHNKGAAAWNIPVNTGYGVNFTYMADL